jgi:hypothetical protein
MAFAPILDDRLISVLPPKIPSLSVSENRIIVFTKKLNNSLKKQNVYDGRIFR